VHIMKIELQTHIKIRYPSFYRHCFRVAVRGIIFTHIDLIYIHSSKICSSCSYSYSSYFLLLSLLCGDKDTSGTFETRNFSEHTLSFKFPFYFWAYKKCDSERAGRPRDRIPVGIKLSVPV